MQNYFPCSLSQGFLPCVFVRGSFSEPCFRNLFRHALSQRFSLEPFPGGFSRAFFCMDGFHGQFRRVVFSAVSRGKFFGAFFSGPSPWTFSRGRLPWALSLGFFWYALSWSPFILHSFVAEISMTYPAGVLSWLFFEVDFLRNIFCRASSAWPLAVHLPWVPPWGHLLRTVSHGRFQRLFCGSFFRAISRQTVSPVTLSQRRHPWALPQELFPCDSLQWLLAFALLAWFIPFAFIRAVPRALLRRTILRLPYRRGF